MISRFWDINCDLGEGEPSRRTEALMRRITSANVACGGHAGDAQSMRACAQLALRHRVRFGAHPGSWDRDRFGRGPVEITPDALELLLLHQVGAARETAAEFGTRLHHIKLHGALYHAVEASPMLATAYLQTVRRRWPGVKVYARAGGAVSRIANRSGVVVWEEAFIDRGYLGNGELVPRSTRGGLLTTRTEIVNRMGHLFQKGGLRAIDGTWLPLRPRTLCVHGDTPGALKILSWVREAA